MKQFSQILLNIKTGDWKAQFHTSGGSAFLQLKNKDDKKTVQQVKDLFAKLPDSLKAYYGIVERDKLDAIGADPSVSLTGFAFPAVDGRLRTELLQ